MTRKTDVISNGNARGHSAAVRIPVKLAAALVVTGLAVSACGTVRMGAAAITGTNRISSATLTGQVENLDAAYQTDQAKGIKPQRPVAQKAQQVLTWLIVFQIYDKLAAQHGISVTPAQATGQLTRLSAQATQSKVTLAEYVSAAGALPPDLLPDLGQYFAIQSALASKLDGGKSPASSAAQSQLSSRDRAPAVLGGQEPRRDSQPAVRRVRLRHLLRRARASYAGRQPVAVAVRTRGAEPPMLTQPC